MTLELFIITVAKIGLALGIVLTADAYVVLWERRLLGFMQKRLGPNRVGPFGLLQPAADGLKFIFKEDIIPNDVSKFLYVVSPVIALATSLFAFSVIPLGNNLTLLGRPISLNITAIDVTVLFVFAMTSLGVYGIVLSGWASNSKYSLLGSLRSTAQLISYELALGLSIVGVLIQAGSLDLTAIGNAQSGWYGLKWFVVFGQPLGFLVFFISVLAETNRVPFDLPEAETELVGGYHTEYSAMKFAMFFVAEYSNMLTASCVATILFFG